MKTIEIRMPKMGESMTEATIISWLKNPGDPVEAEEIILEIATDKVDSEVPAPASGTLSEVFCKPEDVLEVGTLLATISVSDAASDDKTNASSSKNKKQTSAAVSKAQNGKATPKKSKAGGSNRSLSPLVKNIAQKENISADELQSISGTGKNGRLRKSDLFGYLENRTEGKAPTGKTSASTTSPASTSKSSSRYQGQENRKDGPHAPNDCRSYGFQ